jgi:hypothetical protein
MEAAKLPKKHQLFLLQKEEVGSNTKSDFRKELWIMVQKEGWMENNPDLNITMSDSRE